MAKRNTSIRINGRHYDALTGALLSDVAATGTVVRPTAKSIDGVVHGGAAAPTVIKPQKPEVKLTTEPVLRTPRTQKAASKPRATAHHTKAKQAKPSATLMRHAVAKPQATSLKRKVKVQSSTLATTTSMHPVRIAKKTSVYSVNHGRQARAAQTMLHPKISRFAQEVVTVVPSAAEQAITAINKAIVIPQTVAPQHVVYRPDITPARRRPAPSTSDIFEQALQRATSHEQPAPVVKRKSRRSGRIIKQRMISYSAGAVAVLALVGFFGMQHADTIQFKVASNRAGFSATMPSYQPAGFSIDSVRTYNGYVGLKYVADTIEGQRSYAITEKPSSWNSDALLSHIADTTAAGSYRVVEKAGRTVYVYGNNQAAWVSNGILYQLASTNALGNHEIGQIAASM